MPHPPDAIQAMAALSEYVQQAIVRHRVPGAGLGLLYNGAEQTAGFGIASVDTRLAVGASTLFQCGSITKTFTATAIMRLVEQGHVSLEEPIRTYLPDLRLADAEVTAHITLFHLLTHTGGWFGDYWADKGRGEDALARYVADLHQLPQLTPLGTVFSYNNAGFSLAGRVIEVVTEQPWEAAVRELVFDPLRLTETFLFPEEVMTRRFAVGHFVEGDRIVVAHQPQTPIGWRLPGGVNPAGGIGISARDLLLFGRSHLDGGKGADGGVFLSAATLARMQSPLVEKGPAAAVGEAMGLGWHISLANGTWVIEHGGGTNSHLSLLLLVPEHGFVLALLTNASSGWHLREEVRRWALEHLLGLAPPGRTARAIPASAISEYVGRYLALGCSGFELVRGESGTVDRIPLNGRGDRIELPASTGMQMYADDRLVDIDGPWGGLLLTDVLRREDGSVSWLRVGGRIYKRMD